MKHLIAVFTVLASLMVLAGIGLAADHPDTPSTIAGATVVGDDWVKANYQKMKVFDVRKKAEFVEGHLPGAVSIPYEEKSDKVANFDASKDYIDLSKFPSDKSAQIIVYCNGPKCWKSYKTAVTLVKAGYKNVYQYRDSGFPGWKAKGYPVE